MYRFGKKAENKTFFGICDHGSHFILCVCVCALTERNVPLSFYFERQGWLYGHMEAIPCSGHAGQLCRLSSSSQPNSNYV